jgi:pimeloyl-ACP methyl ester carboxylesterase
MMERMAGRMPEARFIVIEGAGHLPNLERPDAFNEVLSAFIEELDSRMQA